MKYSVLLERLGPFPSYGAVAKFIGVSNPMITQLVSKGELEAIQTTRTKRIVLNSLFDFLTDRSSRDKAIDRAIATLNGSTTTEASAK